MPNLNIKKLNSQKLERNFSFLREEINEETRTVPLAFSSEAPVERWFGVEILDHSPESVELGRMQDGAAVLVGHNPNDHVGVVESVSVDGDRRCRAVVRFGRSARATEIFNDVIDGIRKHISVGYSILDARAEREGEKGELEVVRVTKWEPFEVSIVSIPADPSVGVGRSKNLNEDKTMPNPTEQNKQEEQEKNKETQQEQRKMPDVKVIENEAAKRERERVNAILETGKRHGQEELATQYIANGKSKGDFNQAILDQFAARSGDAQSVADLDLSNKDKKEYSLLRAVRAAASKDWKGAEFELECSLEIQDRVGKEARGFYVPFEVMSRTMNTGTAAQGGAVVATNLQSGSFIDLLRAQTLLGQLGATYMTGLVGNVDIPKQTGAAGFQWLAEDGNVTDSDLALASVPMSPKTVAGSVAMTRRSLLQSTPDMEMLVQNDLVAGAALAIDTAAFAGTGAANQPRGILNQTGIATVTLADATNKIPTWAETIGFETALANANTLKGSLSYVTNPTILGTLKTAKKDAGSGEFAVSDGSLNGYSIYQSTIIPAQTTLFGNFNDVIVGMWGVLDINPDTAAKAASGGLVLRVFQDVDIAVRHPQSFCKNA